MQTCNRQTVQLQNPSSAEKSICRKDEALQEQTGAGQVWSQKPQTQGDSLCEPLQLSLLWDLSSPWLAEGCAACSG